MAEPKKRSLDANAYFWSLCGKLAEKTHTDKFSIYLRLICGIGCNFELVAIKSENADRFRRAWESKGIGWPCKVIGANKVKGYVNMCAYYGSSVYSAPQMKQLIDLIVSECKAEGIPTATPDEIANMLSLWEHAPKEVKTSV